ncbi:MAG: hypothetical protein ABF283_04690, partial [Planktotalea arctica]
VAFEPGTYETGTHTYEATAVATDAAGNIARANMDVRVDTEVTNLTVSNRPALGTDSYIGLDDAEGGVTLTGTMETNWTDVAGTPSVSVRFNGVDYPATVNPVTGMWSVNIPEDGIPANFEGSLTYTVTGTDSVGNVHDISRSIDIDTSVPIGSEITGYSASIDGSGTQRYSKFEMDTSDETVGLAQVNADGSVVDLVDGTGFIAQPDAFDPTETEYTLRDHLSDGQSLIVTETDAAGNNSGTYIVLNDGSPARNVSNPNLGDYNIETIELGVMDNTQLTLTEADIKALSGNSDVLSVRGGSDDTVNISGATLGQDIHSEGDIDYNVYSLGDTTIYIEDEITNVNTI